MRSNADVVIIGGGIQGISLAYHLARRGLTDVCLLEMDMLGSGSSGRSATMIGHTYQSERSLSLTDWSFQALMRFEDEIGSSPNYDPIGSLLLAGEQGSAELRRRRHLLDALGVAIHRLDRKDALRMTPGLNLDGIKEIYFLPADGDIDPHAIMMGYARQARQLGAQLYEQVEAIGLEIVGGRVTAVQTTIGPIGAGLVVNAAGARAQEVANWAGMVLPIVNHKRHILVTGPVAAYDRPIPFTCEWETSWYMRREGPGLLIGMGSSVTDARDLEVEMDFVEEVIDHAIIRAPALEEAGLLTCWAGLRPLTPDEDPILGRANHLENFYNDCGWGGHGVMNSPAAGMALAEEIIDGIAVSIDLEPFRAERFREG